MSTELRPLLARLLARGHRGMALGLDRTREACRALGDPQEDAQLQEAVRTILQQLGQDIRAVPAFQNVLKIKFDEAAKDDGKAAAKATPPADAKK